MAIPLHTLLLAALSTAPTESAVHVEGAVRLGVSAPVGEAVPGGPLSTRFSLAVPVRLELGARLSPTTFIGLFGQYGFAVLPAGCGGYCAGQVLIFGFETLFHLAPGQFLDPWFGLGVGIELAGWNSTALDTGSDTYFEKLLGPVLDVQFGLGFPLGQGVKVGPWVGVLFGPYLSRSSGIVDQQGSGSSGQSSLHAWITAGLRLSVQF